VALRDGRRTAIVLSVAAMACLGGCGGGSSSSSSPAGTVKSYMTSLASGDGKAACADLVGALQAAALSQARAQGIKASSCAGLFGQVKAHMTADARKVFLTAKVTAAAISGANATVSVAGASTRPTLRKQGGRWLITGGVGL
jgi:hypothetical protein